MSLPRTRTTSDVEFAAYRARILIQADGDVFDLTWPGGQATVPRAPFIRWALGKTNLLHLAPPWDPICPSGLKVVLDDPNHTDWVCGAGIDFDLAYSGPIYEAALAEMFRLQEELGSFECTVISEGPYARGPVAHGHRDKRTPPGSVVVLPNLHPAYLLAMADAVAVITEAGGGTAHLAQLGRERRLPIVLVRDARRVYPEETVVDVSTTEGKVHLRPY